MKAPVADAPAAVAGDRPVGLGEATRTWLRIGLLSFGGPAGQIALMHRILVEEKGWIDEARFLHALNFCMLLPGPEAQQLAIYVGWMLHRTRGGIVAGTLFVLPGFLVITTLGAVYATHQGSTVLATLFFGLKAAVLAIVVQAVAKIAARALKRRYHLAVAAASFLAIFALSVPFPLIVLAAGLAGIAVQRLRPGLLGDGAQAPPVESVGPAPSWRHAAATVALWGGLWLALPLAFVAAFGRDSVYPTIAGFFSVMAVVTFGGAYAVLAYVGQAAVEGLGWLAPGEMLDGLAMAETTPGPLIIVLSFVGFLAGYRDPGGVDPLLGGLLAATLTTWVTFVPCFLWIFLGAPHVERLRGNRALAAALSSITAAVVGVVLNLAVWFALHTVFSRVRTISTGPLEMTLPDLASLDLAAAALAASAMIAVLRFKVGVVPLLLGCAGLGAVLRLLP